MVIGVHRRAVGVFPNRHDVESALHELRDSGFPMDRVSVIKRDADGNGEIAGAEVQDTVGNKADEGATVGALSGGALGGLTGLLVGLGTLAIPGIGPIMLAGATATAIATTIAGGAIGAAAGGLLGSLVGLGIPEEEARVYNERVQRGNYLVIIDGTVAEIARAEEILHRRGVEEFAVYERPDAETTGIVTNAPGLTKHAVGYFRNRNDAEDAINALQAAGFPLHQISLVHKEPHGRPFSGVSIKDRFDAMRLGLPEARARFYHDRVAHGDYVVTVSGTEDDINRAAAILSRHGIQEWEMYDPTAINSTVGNTTTLQRARRAVGVFPHLRDAEAAIRELRDAGFSMNQVSLLAKDADGGHITGTDRLGADNKAGKSAAAGAATGGALGGLGGLLIGVGALAIPGVGPVIAGGAVATALATAVAGGAIGAAAGGLTGGLVGLGIPENRARLYSDRINKGEYVVFVDGTDDEVRRAEAILRRRGIEEFETFDLPDNFTTTPAIDGIGATPLGYAVTPDPISGIGSAPIGYTPIPETTGIDRPLQTIKRAIGAFPHRRDAEAALAELRDSGFPMNQVSLIAKDVDGSDHIGGVDRNVPTGNKADKGAAAGAATGGALGGLGGLLVGLGTLAIPGIGPVMAGGAVATAIATAITGGAIGAAAGGLTGGLVGLGIPENRAKVYSDRINRGEYVVFVDGTDDEVRRAETILKRRGIQEFEIFDIGRDHVVHPTSTDYSTQVSPDSPPVIVIDNRDRTV
jgi:microcompartment protein CcmL/EutN